MSILSSNDIQLLTERKRMGKKSMRVISRQVDVH